MLSTQHVLVLDGDALTQTMISEWLVADGWQVLERAPSQIATVPGVVVVDLPFPRAGALEMLRAIRAEYPGVPVIVISSTLFGNVGCSGPCAESLGVAGVLPKPVSRETLIAAVRRLAQPGSDRAARP